MATGAPTGTGQGSTLATGQPAGLSLVAPDGSVTTGALATGAPAGVRCVVPLGLVVVSVPVVVEATIVGPCALTVSAAAGAVAVDVDAVGEVPCVLGVAAVGPCVLGVECVAGVVLEVAPVIELAA
jgi:hypothetical protein